MAKIAVKVAGKSRVRAQFLSAGISFVKGVLNIISKAVIRKEDSEYKGDDICTAQIGAQKSFTVMVADIRGAYDTYREKLKNPDEAPALFVDSRGKDLPDGAEEGYINPKIEFKVDNGTLMVAV